jgi:hypothetical protein
MALLDFGSTSGLAYRENWGQDIYNLHQEENLDNIARQTAAARVKDQVDSYKFGSATNEFYKNQLTDFTNKRMGEIGEFNTQHPNAQYNFEQSLYNKKQKEELWNNPIVNNDQHLNDQIKQFQAWTDKNPGVMTDEDKAKVGQQIMNEKKYGDVRGQQGDGGQKFMFVPPNPAIDIQKYLTELGKAPAKDLTTHVGSIIHMSSSDNNVNAVANSALLDPKFRAAMTYQFNHEPDTVRATYNDNKSPSDLLKYTHDAIRSRNEDKTMTDQEYLENLKAGHKAALKKMSGAGEGPVKLFQTDIMDASADQLAGVKKPYYARNPVFPGTGGFLPQPEKRASFDMPVSFVKALTNKSRDSALMIDKTTGEMHDMPIPSGITFHPTGSGGAHRVNGKTQYYADVQGEMDKDRLIQMFSAQNSANHPLIDKNGDITDPKVAAQVTKVTKPIQGSIIPMYSYSVNLHIPFEANATNAYLYSKASGVTGKRQDAASRIDDSEETESNTGSPQEAHPPVLQDGHTYSYNESTGQYE